MGLSREISTFALAAEPRRSVLTRIIIFVAACVFVYVYCAYIYTGNTNNITASFAIRPGYSEVPSAGSGDSGFSANVSSHLKPTNLVFYSKVGKCGGRTMVYLLRLLGKQNNFTAAGQPMMAYLHPYLTKRQQKQLVERISMLRRPATFYRQTHFVDFTRFGYKNPTYINIVRKPLSRFISLYYFKRFGDEKNSNKSHFHGGHKFETLDECVLRNRSECSVKGSFRIIPSFCGQEKGCRTPSRWALEKAKENAVKYFYFIGLTEEYENTLKLLELMLPRFYKGAVETYKTPGAIPSTKSLGKIAPSPKVVEIMNERLALENEFYDFVKDRFQQLKAKHGLMET